MQHATAPSTFGEQAPDDVRYGDVAMMLGEWLGGSVLPAIDAAASEIGDDRWTPETRTKVMLAVGQQIVERFGNGRALQPASECTLEQEAVDGLAQYVVARSLLMTTRQRAQAATARA